MYIFIINFGCIQSMTILINTYVYNKLTLNIYYNITFIHISKYIYIYIYNIFKTIYNTYILV